MFGELPDRVDDSMSLQRGVERIGGISRAMGVRVAC